MGGVGSMGSMGSMGGVHSLHSPYSPYSPHLPSFLNGGRMLDLKARYREEAPGDGRYVAREKDLRWEPSRTAVILCDMWDTHWCEGASRRVAELAPVMGRFVGEARRRGALIVHAPSACM